MLIGGAKRRWRIDASYDSAMYVNKNEVEPYIEATTKPHTLLATYSGHDVQENWFYFSRDNALSSALKF
jgi:hypothetical protein